MSGSIWPHNVRSTAVILACVFALSARVVPAGERESLPGLSLSPAAQAPPALLEPLRSPEPFSLFDRSRLTVNHALAFGVATDGKRTVTNSLYANTLTYRLSEPLTLRLRWGLSGTPTAPAYRFGTGSGPVHMLPPAFELQYRPSEHFMVKVQYAGSAATAPVLPYRFSD